MSRVNRTTASASFSVSFTVGLYGVAFGAAGIAAGFSLIQTCALSLLTFSGASQFAVVGVLGAGGTALSGIATASLLGIRNALYGLRMAPIMKFRGWKRVVGALGAQAMGDPAAWGLDAAVPAAFLGLVWPRLTNKKERTLAVSAMLLALVLTPLVAAGIPIISTALLAVAFGWKVRK